MKLQFLAGLIFTWLWVFFTYTAFAAETNYTYTNQEQDMSGLMHYDSRYYDPELGRFLQPDTLDVPNKYAYVSNDPVNYTDPTGHWETPFFIDFSNTYVPDWQMDYGETSSTTASAGSEFPLNDAIEMCCRIGTSLLPVDPIAAFDTGEYIGEGKLGMAAISGIGIAGFGKWGKKVDAIFEKSFKTIGARLFAKFVPESTEYGFRVSLQTFGKERGYIELIETPSHFFQYKIGKEYADANAKIYSAYIFVEPEFRQLGLAKQAFAEIGTILQPGDVHVINAVSSGGKHLLKTAINEFGYIPSDIPGEFAAWKKF